MAAAQVTLEVALRERRAKDILEGVGRVKERMEGLCIQQIKSAGV